MMVNNNLVGDFNHLEKYEFVNGKDDIPYMMEKMIETTNQNIFFGSLAADTSVGCN